MFAELHCHSYYSKALTVKVEGLNSPEELVKRASAVGLNVLALTDHDEIRGVKEALKAGKKYGVTVIPGEEIKTLGINRKMRGHVIALGIQERIKPDLTVEETLDKIREQGGISIAAHPFDISRRGIGFKSDLCDAIEVFNALNIERLVNRHAKEFAKKRGRPMVAGTDAHSIEMMGYTKTIIHAENDIDAILKAIKNGKTELVCNYVPTEIILDWAIKRLQGSYDSVQKYIRENYFFPKNVIALQMLKLVNRSPGRIDYLFRIIGRVGIAGATSYSALRMMFGL
ncbi:MAG: PHP domain-containing protein [Candidatus Aenigmatarchaeota archaeon]